MRQPEIWSSEKIVNWTICKLPLIDGDYWVPARPLERNCVLPWYHRFKAAWNVLTGKYDAIAWIE